MNDRRQPIRTTIRESAVILAGWGFACAWVILVSARAYSDPQAAVVAPETATDISLVFGLPAWVFWGVAMPWLGSVLFTLWFCLFYMRTGSDETVDRD